MNQNNTHKKIDEYFDNITPEELEEKLIEHGFEIEDMNQNNPSNNNPDFDITDTLDYQSKRVYVAAKRFVFEFIREFKKLFRQ